MQLPVNEMPTTPVTHGTQISHFPVMDPDRFANDPFLGRRHNPPTFFQMLASLTDSPATSSDRPLNTSPSTSVSVDSTMDGRDTPAQSGVLSASVAPMACDQPVVIRRRRVQHCKCHSFQTVVVLTTLFPAHLTEANMSALAPPDPTSLIQPLDREGLVAQHQVVPVGPVVGIMTHW